jgi:hypothetical protein
MQVYQDHVWMHSGEDSRRRHNNLCQVTAPKPHIGVQLRPSQEWGKENEPLADAKLFDIGDLREMVEAKRPGAMYTANIHDAKHMLKHWRVPFREEYGSNRWSVDYLSVPQYRARSAC